MLIFKLAWRSFVRHRRRSLITAIAIAIGLTLMLFTVGTANDSHYSMIEMGVRMGSGHILIQGDGYQSAQTLDHLVNDPADVTKRLRGTPNVKMIVPRVRASGLIRAGDLNSAVVISGVDPKLEPLASSLSSKKKRVKGSYLRSRAQMKNKNWPADVYIGHELAKTLNVELEDKVVITVSPTGGGKPHSVAFTVRGIFRSGSAELDSYYVEIPIREAQKLLKMQQRVTQIALILTDNVLTDEVHELVKQRLAGSKGLEILPWHVALKELSSAIELDDGGNYIFMGIIFVIVAIGIFNTMMMSVMERTREFGVMMAIGTSGRRLFGIVVTEAFVLGVVASLIGLALGLGLHFWVASVGIDVTALMGDEYEIAGIVFDARIYSKLGFLEVTRWTMLVIGIVMASALYPAIRATRLKPVEAMRHV